MPQKAAWTKSAASTKKGAVARSHRVQTRCELGLLKGVLLVVLDRVVRPTRHATDVAKLHADAPQEGPDLGWAAPNAGQRFNRGVCFGPPARWMGAAMRLEGRLLLIQRTGLPREGEARQSFAALLLIHMQD